MADTGYEPKTDERVARERVLRAKATEVWSHLQQANSDSWAEEIESALREVVGRCVEIAEKAEAQDVARFIRREFLE